MCTDINLLDQERGGHEDTSGCHPAIRSKMATGLLRD
jgi:hypothetical protein